MADIFRKLKEGRFGLPNQTSTNQQELEILKREKCVAEQEIFQLRIALKTETQNLTKTFDIKLKDCQDKLDTANRQTQVLNDQVKQLQAEQNTFMDLTGKTHKQEMDKLQTQHQTGITALNARITELQQQLQANQFQQPPPFIPQNQIFNTTANDTVIQNLSTEALASFTKTVSNNGQTYNRQGNYQSNNRHANFQSKSSNNYPRHANKQYNSYKGNPLKQSVQTNAIDDCNPSDNESDHCQDEGMGPHSDNSDTESKN